MKLIYPANSTSVICHIYLADPVDNSGVTGLQYQEVLAYYIRAGGTSTALTTEVIPSIGTWQNTGDDYLGFGEVDSVEMPGIYELHLPNNILATGANSVVVQIRADSSSVLSYPCNLEIQLAAVPSNVTQINGDATDGNNATLKLKRLHIANSDDSAVLMECGNATTSAVEVASVGTASAVYIANTGDGAGMSVDGGVGQDSIVGSLSGSVGSIETAGANALIEALLKYDFSGIAGESQRSLLNAARRLVNKIAVAGATLTVYKEDDATAAFTQSLSTDANQQPIVGMDTD